LPRQPTKTPRAIVTEKKTVAAMVRIYCAGHHPVPSDGGDVCPECATLLAYSHARLDLCPYGGEKPTCRECPIHCYRPAEREALRVVMRFAGSRMLRRHPWLAIVHVWKERFRQARPRTRRAPSNR
jgi:hypothetical protein